MKLVSGVAAALLLLLALAGPVAAEDATPSPTPLPSDCAISSDGVVSCPSAEPGTGGGGSSGSSGGSQPGATPVPGATSEPLPVDPAPATIDPGLVPEPVPCPPDATCAPMEAISCSVNADGSTTCAVAGGGTIDGSFVPCEPLASGDGATAAPCLLRGEVMADGVAVPLAATTAGAGAKDIALASTGDSLGVASFALIAIGTLLGMILGLVAGRRLAGERR